MVPEIWRRGTAFGPPKRDILFSPDRGGEVFLFGRAGDTVANGPDDMEVMEQVIERCSPRVRGSFLPRLIQLASQDDRSSQACCCVGRTSWFLSTERRNRERRRR